MAYDVLNKKRCGRDWSCGIGEEAPSSPSRKKKILIAASVAAATVGALWFAFGHRTKPAPRRKYNPMKDTMIVTHSPSGRMIMRPMGVH